VEDYSRKTGTFSKDHPRFDCERGEEKGKGRRGERAVTMYRVPSSLRQIAGRERGRRLPAFQHLFAAAGREEEKKKKKKADASRAKSFLEILIPEREKKYKGVLYLSGR